MTSLINGAPSGTFYDPLLSDHNQSEDTSSAFDGELDGDHFPSIPGLTLDMFEDCDCPFCYGELPVPDMYVQDQDGILYDPCHGYSEILDHDECLDSDFLVGVETNPGPPKAKSQNKKGQPNNSKKQKPSQRSQPKKKGNSLLGKVGGAVGSILGPLGSQVGLAAGNWISKITGMGAYTINKNHLWSESKQNPSFDNTGFGHIVTHREFLQDISGSTGFALTSFPVNPGQDTTFPWLSRLAANYEQYELLGLLFEYKPTCGFSVGSTNTALGTVIMSTNYDAVEPSFTSKQTMESYLFTTSGSPVSPQIHPIECQRNANVLTDLYVRTGNQPSQTDLRLYDVGNFQIATTGMQAVNVVGELWVTYKVRLIKPRILNVGDTTEMLHAVSSAAGTATQAAPFGTTGAAIRFGSTMSIAFPTTNTFVLSNIGRYLIAMSFVGSTISGVPSVALGANISNLTILNNNTSNSVTSNTVTVGSLLGVINVNAQGSGAANTCTVTGPTALTAGNCDLFIVQIPSVLVLPSTNQRLSELERVIAKALNGSLPNLLNDFVSLNVDECKDHSV